MLAQILVIVHIVEETVGIFLRNEAEVAAGNLLVGRDEDEVVVVTVTVDVVLGHVAVVVAASPGLVDDAEVVAALVRIAEVCKETVRSYVLGVVEARIVRTVHGTHIVQH